MLLLATTLLTGCAGIASFEGVGTVPSFDRIPITFEARGDGDIALVFLHGYLCNRHHWDAQMDAFENDYRVVAIDLGCHGDSPGTRALWSIRDFARDVKAVVEHLDLKKVILVGHSMSGWVALYTVKRIPYRVGAVIGIDTLHNAEFRYSEMMLAPMIQGMRDDFPAAADRLVRGAFSAGADPSVVDRLAQETAAHDPEMAIGLLRSFLDVDSVDAFAGCPAPVFCINTTDRKTEVEINRGYARTSFDAMIMKDVGHFPMLEKPDDFNAVLRMALERLTGKKPAIKTAE